MKILPVFSLKTVLSASLAAALLSTTVSCAVVDRGYDNRGVYRGDSNNNSNRNYNEVRQELRRSLERRGYRVRDIKSDKYGNNRALRAYVTRDNQTYELLYTYPGLRLISSNRVKSSDNHRDDDYKNGKYKDDKKRGKYKNKNKYKKYKD